ncbi:DUF2752 domain-containing protein [Dysgonomonas sp. Marseille-P4677]|uniref:DUF2752 domain-containing protein n=1 Tax=Dysgonomonas sp. Marseille-P4677 TaxID=2364790 RepID=UPI001914D3A4|nr:DUF2752 domain-containing protein [Dysgonomonas sp. Marseille-P4677]MBK5720243.1 DUF2752 domain-containing protein [Dysgonomonas sp. Marseille-P4677]
MKKYLLLLLSILFPFAIVLVYYLFYNMTGDNALCSFREITGLECPGCGGQRALHLLLHGDILNAFRYNIFFLVALPFLTYFYYMAVRVYILKQEQYLTSFVFSSTFGYSLLISVILFFILRNIPLWPFYYLAPPQ